MDDFVNIVLFFYICMPFLFFSLLFSSSLVYSRLVLPLPLLLLLLLQNVQKKYQKNAVFLNGVSNNKFGFCFLILFLYIRTHIQVYMNLVTGIHGIGIVVFVCENTTTITCTSSISHPNSSTKSFSLSRSRYREPSYWACVVFVVSSSPISFFLLCRGT